MKDHWIRLAKGLKPLRFPVAATDRGTARSRDFGISVSWQCSVAGKYGLARTLVSGGYATAGHSGVAEAGWHGSAKAGDYGVARVRQGGIASAGVEGRIEIEWKEHTGHKTRLAVGYVGEGGLKPDTWYGVDAQGNFEEVTDKIRLPGLRLKGV